MQWNRSHTSRLTGPFIGCSANGPGCAAKRCRAARSVSPSARAFAPGVSPGDLLATIYQALGIDPATTVTDRQSRPIRIVDQGQPIRELF